MKKIIIGLVALTSISAFAGKCEVALKGNFPVYWGKLATFVKMDISQSECEKFGLDKHNEFKDDSYYSGKTIVKYWSDSRTYFGRAESKITIKD